MTTVSGPMSTRKGVHTRIQASTQSSYMSLTAALLPSFWAAPDRAIRESLSSLSAAGSSHPEKVMQAEGSAPEGPQAQAITTCSHLTEKVSSQPPKLLLSCTWGRLGSE